MNYLSHLKCIYFFVLYFAVNMVTGQNTEHNIDIELSACLEAEENYSTVAMTECITIAAKSWDFELNKKYRELQNYLTPAQKERLNASQKQWILYRDKEIAFSNQVYLDKDGTASILSIEQTKLELTRHRTLMFISYLADLKENAE